MTTSEVITESGSTDINMTLYIMSAYRSIGSTLCIQQYSTNDRLNMIRIVVMSTLRNIALGAVTALFIKISCIGL